MAGILLPEAFTSSTYLSVKATSLPKAYFQFPPSPEPATLLPPANYPTLAHPFTIPANIYNALLEPSVPITVAIIYVSVVAYLNAINIKNKKPWAISQSPIFKPLVVLHNAVLALYSAWTLVGMINALVLSFPGWKGDYGLAGAVDSLCKINGPRGIGSAAFFNETSQAWTITNSVFHLAADGLAPNPTDVGRIWNEGLAFYGWLFYLSKFYEVIDTFIILAKGRKSSFLQTYHHAGAMLCMWAGIRYMSPPIWMFVLVNSGIHAIMYSFYFCTAVGIKINKRVKQSLTTLQITQFVVGATYAFSHLFIAYQIPVSMPYLHRLGSAVSSVVSALPSEASSAKSAVVASASAGAGAWLKKAALRAAGREGLAENVLNEKGQTFGVDTVPIFENLAFREEKRFRDELQWTHCLDTSGQVFAILLNCLYLAPLTGLFVRFFIKAYLRQMERRRSSVSDAAGKSFKDASKGFSRQVQEMHGSEGKDAETSELPPQVNKAVDKVNLAAGKAKEVFDKSKLNEEFSNGMKQLKQSLREKQAEKKQETVPQAPSDDSQSTLADKDEEVEAKVGNTAAEARDTAARFVSDHSKEHIQEKASDTAQNVKDDARAVGRKVSDATTKAKDVATNPLTNDTKEQTQQKASETAESAEDNAAAVGEKVSDTEAKAKDVVASSLPDPSGDQMKEKASDPAENATGKAGLASEEVSELQDNAKDLASLETEEAEVSPEATSSKAETGGVSKGEYDGHGYTAEQTDKAADETSEPPGETTASPQDSKEARKHEIEKTPSEAETKDSVVDHPTPQPELEPEPEPEPEADEGKARQDRAPEIAAIEEEVEPQPAAVEEKQWQAIDSPNESGTGAEEDSGTAKDLDENEKSHDPAQEEEGTATHQAVNIEGGEPAGATNEGKVNGGAKENVEEPKSETSKPTSIKSITSKAPSVRSVAKDENASIEELARSKDEDKENAVPELKAPKPWNTEEHNEAEANASDDKNNNNTAEVREGTTFADAVKEEL